MIKFVFALVVAMTAPSTVDGFNIQNQVAILPDELESTTGRTVVVKRSRGKGRGRTPYYAKYFKG